MFIDTKLSEMTHCLLSFYRDLVIVAKETVLSMHFLSPTALLLLNCMVIMFIREVLKALMLFISLSFHQIWSADSLAKKALPSKTSKQSHEQIFKSIFIPFQRRCGCVLLRVSVVFQVCLEREIDSN